MVEHLPAPSDLILYRTEDGQTRIEVRLADETVWMTQAGRAKLYQGTKQNISLHLKNIFDDGELQQDRVVKEYLTTAADGKNYRTKFYNLEAILSVGYRVRSPRGAQFRRWATKRLKEYLVKDLRSFWEVNCNKPEYRHIEVCLLRNLPKVGVGMFFRSGFYPDFILWIRNKQTEAVRIVFLDPHGLHHEGVVDNDRFAAIERLRDLGKMRQFKTKKVALDGYILASSDTPLDNIPGVKEKSWDDLEKEYPLLRQEDSYIARLFTTRPWV